jgi:hypothetical protein
MKTILKTFAIMLTLTGTASADDMMMQHGTSLTQGGQSAFAAIQEIVELLEADPKTDWSKVSIETLRQHLIDMNNVTLNAVVTSTEQNGSLQFTVTSEGAVVTSIQNMITAHVTTMNGVDGWRLNATSTPKGAIMTVTPPDQNSMDKLRGLSFIGFMTRGMHHQQHHLMLATGMSPHH